VGFQRDDDKEQYARMRERVMEETRKVFNPEFLNRVDEILVFHHLAHEQLKQVVDIQVAEVIERLAEKRLLLNLTEEAKEFLVRVGSNEEYGARPLRRAVQQYIEDPLAEMLLKGGLQPDTAIEVRPSGHEERLAFEPAVRAAEGVIS